MIKASCDAFTPATGRRTHNGLCERLATGTVSGLRKGHPEPLGLRQGVRGDKPRIAGSPVKVDRLNAASDPSEPIEAERLKARRDALHRELMMLMGANMR